MSGVQPGGLISAPRAWSILTIASLPLSAATARGRSPKRFVASTLAPAARSMSTLVSHPERAAISKTGSPFGSTVFGSMPRASSSLTSPLRSATTAWMKRSYRPSAGAALSAPGHWRTQKATAASHRASMRTLGHSEQAEEVLGGRPSDVFDRHATQPSDLLGDVAHVSGLVGLAAIRHRREIRRIGLDQHLLEGNLSRDLLEGLR